MADRTHSTASESGSPVDINGWSTEENGFPVNMMWGGTKLFRGMDFEEAVRQMTELLKGEE